MSIEYITRPDAYEKIVGLECDYLVIAGGAGGGGQNGGGGGAGGYLSTLAPTVETSDVTDFKLTLAPGSYAVTVGGGGASGFETNFLLMGA